ncbi:hypothetical protein TgHK011_008955 [Trichoderma gracile]|nr:hypothetical protein TgHK011_008955 [Trichoderma gracile]
MNSRLSAATAFGCPRRRAAGNQRNQHVRSMSSLKRRYTTPCPSYTIFCAVSPCCTRKDFEAIPVTTRLSWPQAARGGTVTSVQFGLVSPQYAVPVFDAAG